jgi:hypothetical protein
MIGTHLFSSSTPSSMNYAGSRPTAQNATTSVRSNWTMMNGSASTHFWVYWRYVHGHCLPCLKYITRCQHADNAQQAFSSEQVSTLHLAIPALEALHRAWSSRSGRPKYKRFTAALDAACSKVDEYYEKTTEAPAYILAMSK